LESTKFERELLNRDEASRFLRANGNDDEENSFNDDYSHLNNHDVVGRFLFGSNPREVINERRTKAFKSNLIVYF
jgi:hypothetical protein